MIEEWKARAGDLLEEFNLCCRAKPKHDAVNIQLEKDTVARFAYHLATQRSWGTEQEIAEAYYQLEPRLAELKKKLIIEILQNGSV
jgi:hypothetical protein